MKTEIPGVLEGSGIFFHTPSHMAKSMFFYLLSAGHFWCNADYFVQRERYGSFLLMYIQGGDGKVSYQGKTAFVKAGDIILLDCNHPHYYAAVTSWEILWIHFEGNVSRQFYDLLFERVGFCITMKTPEKLHRNLEAIVNACSTGSSFREPVISCYIHQILTELFMETNQKPGEKMAPGGLIADAVGYIEKHFNRKITLKELSNYVKLSPYYFSRVFKKETGYSPYEYILMTRLNRAKELLKTTDKLNKEIAFDTGFGSESNFATAFRVHIHLTPGEFRNIHF